MRKILVITVVLSLGLALQAQADKLAYRLFSSKGQKTTWNALVKAAAGADVILFGEYHNNTISHWLEYEIALDMLARNDRKTLFGFEMFEADQQQLLTDYLVGNIEPDSFLTRMRLWNNYETDYAPIIDLAKEFGTPCYATNIPRIYASLVAKQGLAMLNGLKDLEKSWMMPLPVVVDTTMGAYMEMRKMMEGHGGANAGYNFVCAQAVKDATMAWFILKGLQDHPGARFVHYNGAFHSDRYESISWYLNHYRAGLKVVTISTIEAPSVEKIDKVHIGLADFIIAVPETMTKTY